MKEEILSLLRKLSGHDFIRLTSRGNTAIYTALYCAKELNRRKLVLVPDQGGWFTYKKYPKQLDMKLLVVKTDFGVIDVADLREKSKDANCIIYSTPAGYFAEQPVKEIYSICRKNKCIVILDITGSIGRHDYGKYCDFAVCSFGDGKPINLGYGGFVSAVKKGYFDEPEDAFISSSFEEEYYSRLLEKLKSLKERHQLFDKVNKKVKKELSDYDIIHRNKEGINVIVKFRDESEKKKIIDYCEKNKLEFTICPRYIRVKAKAVSIEVKRLE